MGRAQKAIIDTPAGPVTVFNMHTNVAVTDEGWLGQREQLQGLADEIVQASGPIIAGGDFNTTPYTDNYALISNLLQDTHQLGGRGFGFTFPAHGLRDEGTTWLPMSVVRLDHILVNEAFVVDSTSTIHSSFGSDHLRL